jgi:hypothetical protein
MKSQTYPSFTKPIETPHPTKGEWLRIVWSWLKKLCLNCKNALTKQLKLATIKEQECCADY